MNSGGSKRTRVKPERQPRRGRWTIRARMAFIVTLVCALGILLVAGGLFVTVDRLLFSARQQTLVSASAALQTRLERMLPFGRLQPEELTGSEFPPDVLYRVTMNGRVVAASEDFPEEVPWSAAPGDYRFGSRLVLVRPWQGRFTGGLITLVTENNALSEARAAYVRALLLLLPGALVLAVAAGWFAAGRMLRPVRQLERAAWSVAESGELTRPLPGAGQRDELERLALTLQRTFARLAETRAREQEFVRAAAHDLRGPLTALRSRVALSLARERDARRYRADLVEVEADLVRLAHLAGHLLLLARNPDTLSTSPVELRDVVAEVVDRVRSEAPDQWVDVRFDGNPRVMADRVLLEQAVYNLLSNAVRHAPGARVEVSVGVAETPFIRVSDQGPGVRGEVLARLGEAFYRPDAARSGEGHGLGLAIVAHIAALHGATLNLESAPGEGFAATLRWSPSGQSATVL